MDDTPVTLMAGSTPAWRPFGLGMTDGPDVRQLQADLIAGHFAGGLFTAPTGHYDLLTADAVERWQAARGMTATGLIPLGQVIFLPGAVLVGGMNVAAGEAAAGGQQPYQVTTAQRTVTVPLNPDLPPAGVGEVVSIILPSQASTPGRITAVARLGPAHGDARAAAGHRHRRGTSRCRCPWPSSRPAACWPSRSRRCSRWRAAATAWRWSPRPAPAISSA